MLGAIAGDIIGSVYEWHNIKTKEFPLFSDRCSFTDDTVLTVALADAILTGTPYATNLKAFFRRYPGRGYGGSFYEWAQSEASEPYNSYGNGAAMHISPVGFAYNDLHMVLAKAAEFTAVTHNHPEGIKGGQATAAAIFLARTGKSKEEIKAFIEKTFHYDLSKHVAHHTDSTRRRREQCRRQFAPLLTQLILKMRFARQCPWAGTATH